ncbi:MAG: sigma-70 family RNA polymerase sigma factor [Pseudomonadota bacterium]
MSADTTLNSANLTPGRSLLTRLFGSEDIADEAVQAVGEKLAKSGDNPSPAYLTTMLRNAAVDTLRAENTRQGYEARFALETSYEDSHSPEAELSLGEMIDALQAGFDSLTPLSQEIFVRAYLDEQPRAEIANALGIKLSTVEKRLGKAKRHCLHYLREHLLA